MAYLASIHRPSSVRHALKLNFLSPEDDTLVVAKANRLEFYSQQEDGLVLQHTRSIYGKVTMLQRLRPASAQTDHLFVGTDAYMYFTLSWNPKTKQLHTEKSYKDVAEKAARDSQTGERCNVDPTRRLMALELYEGIVNLVPIVSGGKRKSDREIGTLAEPIPVRIPELSVRASAFLHRSTRDRDRPQLALLHQDSMGKLRLKLREIEYHPSLRDDAGSADMSVEVDVKGDLELGASHLIPLGAPAYGCLILGETSISYCDSFDYNLHTEPLEEATIFVAWEQIDDQRFVLADEYGKLYLLMINLNHKQDLDGWQLDVLGETSRASTLVYLDAGRIFVGSHQGNSQVVQIKQGPEGKGSMDIIQTFPNIAPILDFTVMDMGNRSSEAQVNEYSSGQARLVTGSGAFKDGSLRSVRSGVGLEDLGSIGEMHHVTDLFSLKSDPELELVDTLLVSFVTNTRVFKFGADGEVEEVDEFKGINLDRTTLFAINTTSGHILQVTDSSAIVTDTESGMALASWSPEGGSSIAAASASGTSILLSISGVGLALLDFAGNGLEVQASRRFDADSQVACIALSPLLENTCVVGFWQRSTVALLDKQTLETVHTETDEADSIVVPRSLIVAQILEDSLPTLFVGMADGNVVTYALDPATKALSGRKSTILGTQQANFKILPRGTRGLHNVFATCEHPSLIYGSEGRIVYSAITAEDATCVCPLDTEAYPNAIAIATDDELKLAVVDEERTTHVQTLQVGETVRRIAYSAEVRAFGLGTIKRTLEDSYEKIESHFKLVDEIAFQELHTYPLKEEELVECCIRAKLDDGSGELAERFIVGTAYMDEESTETARGRILVFEVTAERRLKLVAEKSLKGACRCLGICQGKIVAALIKTVVVYDFKYETASTPFLDKVASYRTSTAPIDLAITGDLIAVADLMKSVSLVRYTKGHGGLPDSLEEVGRHYETTWGTAVAHIDEDTYLEGDAEGNLIVLSQEAAAYSEEDRRKLRVTSDMRLGEMVNRIRRIDVLPTTGAIVVPRAFLATVEGSIYLFALISAARQDLLMRLQEKMAQMVQSPGHVPFNRYRAFKTMVREADEPNRFVDGDLIERFLDCDDGLQSSIVEGLGVEVDEVREMVESLKRLH